MSCYATLAGCKRAGENTICRFAQCSTGSQTEQPKPNRIGGAVRSYLPVPAGYPPCIVAVSGTQTAPHNSVETEGMPDLRIGSLVNLAKRIVSSAK